jgi:predicted acetylornithine/succinylornithine family transaminase
MSHWLELEQKYYMRTFNRLPVVLVRGEGTRVWDENGRCYLDMVAGIAVNVLGHCHPAVVEALTRQARTLIHTSNLYYTIPQLELAELLINHSCADRVFFANSGAEANEGAIKLARKYGRLHRHGAYEIITVTGSFHGRTLATLAATAQPKYQEPFAPMPEGFRSVPFNDLEALQAATTERTCAVLLEVVQGESGVHLADGDYLRGVRAWCDQHNLLLILDEIQTGMGRTGRFLAYEHHGIEPDIFTMAKGLAGGVPIGAVLAKERAAVFTPGDHGSTFGGNPLACAAGVATVRTILEQDLAAHSARVGRYLLEQLRALQTRQPAIAQVRGLGLMVAFDLTTDRAAEVVRGALQRGLILNNTGPRTIRMVPPLILTEAEVDEAVAIIAETLADLPAA